MKEIKLIFAGDYIEFLDWCKENKRSPKDPDIKYVSSPEHIMGFKNYEIIKYGTWFNNEWITPELIKELEIRREIYEKEGIE